MHSRLFIFDGTDQLTELEFWTFFRMNRDSFQKLFNILEPILYTPPCMVYPGWASFRVVVMVVYSGLPLMPSVQHFELSSPRAESSWWKVPMALPDLLLGSFVDASLQLMDGLVRQENHINLRVLMLAYHNHHSC
jgi:hypothetical protein